MLGDAQAPRAAGNCVRAVPLALVGCCCAVAGCSVSKRPVVSPPLVSKAPAVPSVAQRGPAGNCDPVLTRAVVETQRAFVAVRDERLRRGITIDPRVDPVSSGLIGVSRTPITTVRGNLVAKQASVNAAFAAVIVEMLRAAGVRPGDAVAVGLSGSFPALNIASLAAIEALGAQPLAISSVGASTWGANHPRLTWPAMEKLLVQRSILRHRSIGASRGGAQDIAKKRSEAAKRLMDQLIQDTGLTPIAARAFRQRVEARMALYRQHAAGRKIAAYINVGGVTTSVGGSVGKRAFSPGLNTRFPVDEPLTDGVIVRFSRSGVPAIHLVQIRALARQYRLPVHPAATLDFGRSPLRGQICTHDRQAARLCAHQAC